MTESNVDGPSYDNRTCVSGMAATGWDLADELAMYPRIGSDLVGLASHKIEAYGHDRAIAAIARSGVHLGYVVHPFMADPADTERRAAERDALITAIDTAAEVGAGLVYFTSGRSGRLTWEAAAEAFAALIAPAVQHAGERGIALAVENTLPVRCDLSFTHSVRDAMALARRSGTGICLDYYCCWQEGGLAETVASGVELVNLVQVSDFRVGTQTFPNRWVPGDADLPMDRLLGEVLAAGYRGIVDLELSGPAAEQEGVESALRRGVGWITEQLGR